MKKLLFILSLMLIGTASALAQRTITGKVVDNNGEPLVGATVLVKGTSAGTASDVDGNFTLNVPEGGAVLIVSYTGFTSQEVVLGVSNYYDIIMASDVTVLQDVVVVGYGTQQRRDLTGNISTIKGDEIAALAVQSFDQALQGRAVGVNVNLPNGVLNNPPVFRVRGINSINLSSFPLIVIDGIPTFTGDISGTSAANNVLASINPADIESIDILKDASAAAIYGSRASAGVVLITTKRGKKGTTKVGYDAWVSLTAPARLPELLNAEQYITVKNEAARNANLTDRFFPDVINGQPVDTRWYDYVYRTGFSHNHSLNFSGGSESTNFFVSLNYTNQEGMIVRNDFERKAARLNLDHRVGKWLTLGTTINYANNFNSAPNTGSLPGQAFNTSGLARLPLVTAPNVAPYNADGSYNIAPNNQIGRGKNLEQSGFVNPVPIIDLNNFTSTSDRIQAAVYGQVNLFRGLYFRSQYGVDNITTEDISFQTPIHGDGFGNNGLAQNLNRRTNRWNWQNILNYDLSLLDKHNFNFLVGNEQQYTTDDRWGATRTVIADPFFTTYQGNFTTINPAGNFQGENYLLSYFGRINYNFNKKFLLSVNLRSDEYSAFAPGRKQGVFWGASGGYAISEENFWKSIFGNTINYFRLRGSYGEVGNFNGIGNFASLSLYASGLYGPNPTLFFNQAGNTELSWETSKKTDIGINFGLFNDKIQGEVTYFRNLIDGLILAAPQAPSKGIPGNSIDVNIGSMRNTGVEIGLNGTILRKNKFTWSSSFNITFMSNEVLSLVDENSQILQATAGLETVSITKVGEPIGSIRAVETRGVNPATGQRIYVNAAGREVQYNHAAAATGRWTYLDGTVAPAISVITDGKIYGPTIPTWFGAWDHTFRYSSFDLNIQLQYSGGNLIYNGTKAGLRDMRFWNNHTDVLNRWQREGDVTNIPRVVYGDNISNGSAFPISENIERGDFLRVRNLALGYSLPRTLLNKANIANLRVYVMANNAFLFTQYTGTDPEVSTNGNENRAPGVDRNTVPMARTLTIGLNLGF
ncbi:MAG TPA: TonB-dependent receptor [Saprospiraceae bacterium]|nr:TonB-dependent receptor [Saprospiraceae bacterium]